MTKCVKTLLYNIQMLDGFDFQGVQFWKQNYSTTAAMTETHI